VPSKKQEQDFPDRSGDKVDISVVLRRRKIPMKRYLSSVGVKDLATLRAHLRELRKEYLVPKEFVEECTKRFRPVVQKSKPSVEAAKPATEAKKTTAKKKKQPKKKKAPKE
jgi:hypothetical protein